MTPQPDSDSIAQYLLDHPHFFEEHAELLARVKLTSPVVGRTVSLQERQMEVLREKMKIQELRMAELLRIGQDNDFITRKFHAWTRALLLARNDVDLPHTLISELRSIFSVPQATLRLWNVAPEYSHAWFAQGATEDCRIFTNSLRAPFCGKNNDFEAASWLDEAATIQSIAMLALRADGSGDAFGLLVLGSPDPQRFTADMATDFLAQIGETASAALGCLLD
ncbi:MAG TPA: DUF484 family protein [Paucimonas sp.]|nr:DUF484 family protein [Paucimonas sp.]